MEAVGVMEILSEKGSGTRGSEWAGEGDFSGGSCMGRQSVQCHECNVNSKRGGGGGRGGGGSLDSQALSLACTVQM